MRTLCHVIINTSCGGDVEDLPLLTDAVAVAEMWRRCLVTTSPRTGKSRVTKSRLQWTHRVRCCYLKFILNDTPPLSPPVFNYISH